MGIDVFQTQMENRERDIKETQRAFQKTYPSNNGLMIPEIMVLYYARSFRTDTFDFQSFWKYNYGIENVRQVINSLVDRGFIFVGSIIDGIEYYKVPELKQILEEHGLKKTGNKKDLVLRIVQNIPEQELEAHITSRPYGLTQLGIEELENNQYVPYFHKTRIMFPGNISVFWLNKELHTYPQYRTHWRDLIWGRLNSLSTKYSEEMYRGKSYDYSYNRRVMAQFVIEEERYEAALPLITEALYVHLNKREAKRFFSNYRFYVLERHSEIPVEGTHLSAFLNEFVDIKKGLELGNEDFAVAIREYARFPRFNDEIFPLNLISAWVLAEIMKNDEQSQFLCNKYEQAVIRHMSE